MVFRLRWCKSSVSILQFAERIYLLIYVLEKKNDHRSIDVINTWGGLMASTTRCLPPDLESTFSEYFVTLEKNSDSSSQPPQPESTIAGVYYKFPAIWKKHGIRIPDRSLQNN